MPERTRTTAKTRKNTTKSAAAGRPRDVDALIAGAPADKRPALRRIRAAIRRAAPAAAEAVAYGGLAGYKYRGRVLVYFGYATGHVGLYGPIRGYIDAHPRAFAGYEQSRGTLRLPADRPVPEHLVAKIVKARIAEIDARA